MKRKILLHELATLYKLVLGGKLYICGLVIIWAIRATLDGKEASGVTVDVLTMF